MEQLNQCKNCQNQFTGKFCNQCGQKWIDWRWNNKKLIVSASSAVFNLEKGFFFTFKNLLLRPGKMVREYLDGKTVNYTNPFRYALLAIAASVFIAFTLGVWDLQVENIVEGYKKIGLIDSKQSELEMKERMSAVAKFINIIPLALLPFIAFTTKMIFSKQRLLYAEYTILTAFVIGQATLYGIISLMITYLFPSLVNLFMGAGFFIAALVYSQIFKTLFDKHYLVGFLLGLISYILGFMIAIVSMMIIGVLLVLIILLFKKFTGL